MGVLANSFLSHSSHARVDFAAVSRAALGALDNIAHHYLPDGRREGHEWVARNPTRADGSLGSFKLNLGNGVWADFATGDKGGDAIDLVAYLEGKSKLDAARSLADMLNVPASQGSTSTTGNVKPVSVRKLNVTATPDEARIAPTSFPLRTHPNQDGKPRFVVAGDEGPRIRDDEKRRHVYRQGGVPVRIKIMRKGESYPFNVYRVTSAEGVTGWQYAKPEGFKDVPFLTGTDPLMLDGPIYWPEGEKDTETISRAGLPALTFGGTGDGLPEGCAAYFIGRHVVILADNDEAGLLHAERKAELASTVAAGVKVIHFPDTDDKGDVSDWLPNHSLQEMAERVEQTPDWKPADHNSEEPEREPADLEQSEKSTAQRDKRFDLPFGYRFHDNGLYWSDPNDDEKPDMHLSSSFDIVAETRDGDGASWGLLMHWVDHDGRDHRMALPRSMLAGDGSEARKMLLDGGMYISPGQKARQLFNAFLLQVRSPVRARATQRIGWHGDAFVLPDDCYGSAANDSHMLQTATAHEHAFRQSGTLESWRQNVARYAVGNSRLVLAISAAFAGPLIGPCSAEGGGIHFRGASSTGKSTALHVAGSVWGGGDVNGFVRSWRATSNGLEGVALGHSDALLCLDEISQLAARDAGEAAYMLSNGSGKSRSTRDGSARKPARWRVMFISSGEIGLADKIAEDGRGRKMAAGQQVRIIDIPADAGAGFGLFETLHDFPSADAFARHLGKESKAHYGVAAREYLKAIVPGITDIRQGVAAIMAAFSEQYVPLGADGQVERVAQRFALIAAGGEIAARAGVLPWKRGEAISAAGKCFDDWLAQRGGIEPAEAREGIEQVRSFLLTHGMARFIPAWEDDADKRIPVRDLAGFRKKMNEGGWDFYVNSPAWKEMCTGLDPRRTAAVLQQREMLLTPEGGAHRAKLVTVPGHGKMRLYHIPADFMEGGNDA